MLREDVGPSAATATVRSILTKHRPGLTTDRIVALGKAVGYAPEEVGLALTQLQSKGTIYRVDDLWRITTLRP